MTTNQENKLVKVLESFLSLHEADQIFNMIMNDETTETETIIQLEQFLQGTNKMLFVTKFNNAVNDLINAGIITGVNYKISEKVKSHDRVCLTMRHNDIKKPIEVLIDFDKNATVKDIKNKLIEDKHRIITLQVK